MSEVLISNRIDSLFGKNINGKKIMSLFLTAGFPTIEDTSDLILRFEEAGADIIELGMPYSDPLADGPTIQYSSDVAIRNGITIGKIFEIVREIRKNSSIPIVLMGYINPILNYGIAAFCRDARLAGADGLIIPDIPIEEKEIISEEAKQNHLHVIQLVAPNTSDERMRKIDSISGGFVYCVSVTGVTGSRTGEEVQKSVDNFIDRVCQNITQNPFLIGFGISNSEDARRISARSNGFIVGSALIETIRMHYPNADWKEKTVEFVKSLRISK